jgi:hypothetical protein
MSEHELASEFEDFEGELPDNVDQAAVDRMRLVAQLLDDAVPVPGTNYRIGLDPIMGAAPVAGDVVTGLISLYIVAESARLGVSYGTLLKMLLNVSIDIGGGSIPFVGTIFDAAFKSNKRNVKLLVDELKAQSGRGEDQMTIDVD